MGYFSEMALNKQEELGLPAEQVSAGNAFEDEETFDELPVASASSHWSLPFFVRSMMSATGLKLVPEMPLPTTLYLEGLAGS